jgi:hypothetical protein
VAESASSRQGGPLQKAQPLFPADSIAGRTLAASRTRSAHPRHNEGERRRRRSLRRWERTYLDNQLRMGDQFGAQHSTTAGGEFPTSNIEQDSAGRKLAQTPCAAAVATNAFASYTITTVVHHNNSGTPSSSPRGAHSRLHPISRFRRGSAPPRGQTSTDCQHFLLPQDQVRAAAQLRVSRETQRTYAS